MEAAVNDRLLTTVITPNQANLTSTINWENRSFLECSRWTGRTCGSETHHKGRPVSKVENSSFAFKMKLRIYHVVANGPKCRPHRGREGARWQAGALFMSLVFDYKILPNQVIVLAFARCPWISSMRGCATLGRLGGGQNFRWGKEHFVIIYIIVPCFDLCSVWSVAFGPHCRKTTWLTIGFKLIS